jgi:transposase-like protein
MLHTDSRPATGTGVLGEVPEPENWVAGQLTTCRTVRVLISSLALEGSPRSAGENVEHIKALAQVDDRLPPIVVHGPSGRVIDGMHRVRAAMLRGEETIEAKIYPGPMADAFVLSVRMNTSHGMPLSLGDRKAAAARIIASHRQWSNRIVAAMTGLAASTVAAIRERSTDRDDQSITRIGQDGRVRPLNGAAGRLRAHQLLIERPTASVRTIAREAGVSPSTVQDVRQRLAAGQDPLPPRQRMAAGTGAERTVARPRPERRSMATGQEVGAILAGLMRDPSMRFSDTGRFLLRWLDMNRAGMDGYEQMVERVPDHCADAVAKLARGYAEVWQEFASRLEARRRVARSS